MPRRPPMALWGERDYWRRRARSSARRLRVSLLRARARDAIDGTRERASISFTLFRQSLSVFASGAALFGAVELVGIGLASLGFPAAEWLGGRVSQDAYRDLVGAGVGAIATFLGLYYATVGVVASTVYQAVPGSIRALFVEEPNGVIYVRGVVRSLVFGLAILLWSSVGVAPTPLGLVAFTLLAAISVLRLMVLGARIFGFFDPSALGSLIGRRFSRALRRASARPASADPAAQQAAYAAARSALTTYQQLGTLIAARKSSDGSGSARLTSQLLRLAQAYARVKYLIPSNSNWWEQKPTHANWMTLDHSHLEMSLMTGTGVQPTLAADQMWVEEALAKALRSTFTSSYDAAGSVGVMTHSSAIANLGRQLASLLQVNEALVFEAAWRRNVARVTESDKVDIDVDHLGADGARLNQLAAAEQLVHPFIQIWLGYVDFAQWAVNQDLEKAFAQATERQLVARPFLPPKAHELSERFVSGMRDEIEAEGHPVSPPWWRNHYLAKAMLDDFTAAGARIYRTAEKTVGPAVNGYLGRKRFDLASVTALASLELFHKAEVHHSLIVQAVDTMDAFRNDNTANGQWPSLPLDETWPSKQREVMLGVLATCLPNLRTEHHTPGFPDLHGQVYRVLFDAAFYAIIEGRHESAQELLGSVILEAEHLRARTASDLAGRDLTTVLVHALDPVVGAMELSGYARLMQELDGEGIWPFVDDFWRTLLDASPGSEERLVLVLEAVESVFALTTGGLMRTTRMQHLSRVLRERGIEIDDERLHFSGKAKRSGSPIIDTYAGGDMRVHEDLADLFVVEVLVDRLPADFSYSPRIRSLMHSLGRDGEQKPNTKPRANGDGKRGGDA